MKMLISVFSLGKASNVVVSAAEQRTMVEPDCERNNLSDLLHLPALQCIIRTAVAARLIVSTGLFSYRRLPPVAIS